MRKSTPPHDEAGTPPGDEATEFLRAWSDGDRAALDSLTAIVYDELRRLARRYMKSERPGHSLQTTASVNEAYMRLVDYVCFAIVARGRYGSVEAKASILRAMEKVTGRWQRRPNHCMVARVVSGFQRLAHD